MTELEKMQHACKYVKKLANGIDPMTDSEMPSDSTFNNVRIARCMFYVAEILDKVIENGGEVGGKKRQRKAAYFPTLQDVKDFKAATENLHMSGFLDHLALQYNKNERGNIKRAIIIDWLLKNEFLARNDSQIGSTFVPTEKGDKIGISVVLRETSRGKYHVVLYSPVAQQLMIDSLIEIYSEAGEQE